MILTDQVPVDTKLDPFGASPFLVDFGGGRGEDQCACNFLGPMRAAIGASLS